MDIDADRGTFGPVLRRFRLAAGMSQEQLAEAANLSVESISALERGRRRAPYRETVRLLGTALGLSDDGRRELETAAKRARSAPSGAVKFDSTDAGATTPVVTAAAEKSSQNLSRPLSIFHNRYRELADLASLLTEYRLVSIVGAGGIGKTRLAVELAWGLLERYPDGIWFVDLAPLSDHAQVARSVIDALAIPHDEEHAELETLKHHLRRRDALIIVDNCEHVIEQVAMLTDALLQSCETLTILTTSREPLRVVGERVYRIPPLAAPDRSSDMRAEESLSFPAVALFVDRSKAANSGFIYDDRLVDTIGGICRRLDGIALAIELAASRTVALTPLQILGQLDDHFRILSGGSRTALPRQRTMLEAIRWSYDRLGEAEQKLFRRMAVFANGFTLDAVCTMTETSAFAEANILDVLGSLVDKSLVVVDASSAVTRYRLLEPMRAYGLQMLAGAEETASARLDFAAWCVGFAQRAHADWATVASALWSARVEPEMDNLRAGLIWTLGDRNDIELGQRLVSIGRRIWARLSPAEGKGWIAEAQRLAGPQTSQELRAALALAEAHLRVALQQYSAALSAAAMYEREAIDRDELDLAEARSFAGYSLVQLGRSAEGYTLMAASVDAYRAHDAKQLLATGINDLAVANLMRGDLLAARRLFREALTIFRELNNERGTASAAANLAETEYAAGNVEAAILLGEEAVATSRRGREARIYLSNMAAYLVRTGRYDEARERARESILCGGLARADVEIALALQHLAAVAALRTPSPRPDDEDIVRAAHLVGFVDFRLTTYEATRIATELHEYEVMVNALRVVLGDERFTELRQRGQAWSEDDAVEAAMKI